MKFAKFQFIATKVTVTRAFLLQSMKKIRKIIYMIYREYCNIKPIQHSVLVIIASWQ